MIKSLATNNKLSAAEWLTVYASMVGRTYSENMKLIIFIFYQLVH